jgi:hypothetical protein
MEKDHKRVALTKGRLSNCKVGEVMELQPIPEEEEAVLKVEHGPREVPIFVSSCA